VPSLPARAGVPAEPASVPSVQDSEFRQLVERVKLRSPIDVVVGERVGDLRKKGALHWARCPFHEEKTPSFAVDPRRGTWRCFGACGEGGDVLSFVQRFDGLSFLDALRLLARAAGEDLPDEALRRRPRGPADDRREALLDVLQRAQLLFEKRLRTPEGAQALAYVRDRGFDDECLSDFGIGWAPERGNAVCDAAGASGIGVELLEQAGLAKRSDDGRPYDFFRGRLMIPIADRLGRVVGFGGRMLPGDTRSLGKYVNTPETELFRKGELVYGLHRAAGAVRRSRHLVLVEGYTDVMAAHQAGLANVAAILGTSTTDEHAGLVRRTGAERVTLVFDGDEAGRKASGRALAGLLPLGIDLRVATPPAGSDPCDLCFAAPSGGAEGEGRLPFERLLDDAVDWFAWTLDPLEGLGGAALARGVDEVFGLLGRLTKPVEVDARLRETARRLRIDEAALRRQWQEALRRGERRPEARPAELVSAEPAPQEAQEADPALEGAFRSLVGAMLLDNSLIPVYGDWEPRCPRGDLRTIFRAVLELYDHGEDGEPIHAGSVMTALGEDPARDLVVGLEELARTAESPQLLARDQELWLERRRHERELVGLRETLTSTLVRGGPETEGSDAESVLRDLHERLKRRVPERAET